MSRVFPPLLPNETVLYVYGSLPAGSPHVMESDCSADPGIWSDLHLRRSDRSEYSHGRYAWICGVSSRPHPSRSLHLEHTPQEVPPPPGLPVSPLYWPPIGRATSLRATIDRQAHAMRATASQATMPLAPSPAPPLQAPQMAPPMCQPLPPSGSQLATPYQQAVWQPVKPKGRGVTFDSSADKVAAVGGQDADGHEKQRTHDRDDKTQPTSPGRGACDRSSSRMTSKQTLGQVGEHPSDAAHKAPRDSTLGGISHQYSSSMRAPKDPLRHVACFRSQGWRKDLDLIFKAYYKYNFSSFKESEWSKIRHKVLDHFLPLQEEWRGIKENDPLQYMPYMEEQFFAATRIWLKGLAECTTWIKWGSYYHSVVARKGQLHKCPHLVGIEPPKGPQMTPSESHLVSQRKLETLATSSSAPAIEASTLHGATADVAAPMETGGAGNGHSAQEIYRHSGQQPLAHHIVATMGITHLHLEVLPRDARSLGNQVLCMIMDYHLASHAQGSSSLSPALPEAARMLLPSVDKYIRGVGFCGTRDVRVMERAKTL